LFHFALFNKTKNSRTNSQENSDNECSLNSSNTEAKHIVCIENLLTDQIVNEELNELLQIFLDQNSRYQELGSSPDAINSIRVFTNSIYVCFDDESLACDAAEFLNDYKLKEFILRACLISNNVHDAYGNALDDNNGDHGQNGLEQHNNVHFKNRTMSMKQKVSNDCEILIENRQLKYFKMFFYLSAL
jgi:hypothetical protein